MPAHRACWNCGRKSVELLTPGLHFMTDQLKQDEIAARQPHSLHAFQHPREKKPRRAEVKEMFLQMRDHASPLERESPPTAR